MDLLSGNISTNSRAKGNLGRYFALSSHIVGILGSNTVMGHLVILALFCVIFFGPLVPKNPLPQAWPATEIRTDSAIPYGIEEQSSGFGN